MITVGASVSAADTAVSLTESAQTPVYAVVRNRYNQYFGDEAFKNPKIERRAEISHITGRTVYLKDGTELQDVDNIIFGTGFTWALPYLPQVPTRNNRVPDLYQHVFWKHDPTLVFIGAVGAGLTFKIFEWQAVAAARVLAGRASLPSIDIRQKWEDDRISELGDGPGFMVVHPHFRSYFENLRELSGEPHDGKGRPLPVFDEGWVDAFNDGHELRKKMWRRLNRDAHL